MYRLEAVKIFFKICVCYESEEAVLLYGIYISFGIGISIYHASNFIYCN